MKVEVQFEGLVANVVGKKKAEVDLPGGASARDLIEHLVKEYGSSLEYLLLTPQGDLRPLALIQVNGGDLAQPGGLDAPFDDQAQVTIAVSLHAAAGG
ncbi:MAG: MoaD/ThiS family protein [Dehalococcoidia bacterium]